MPTGWDHARAALIALHLAAVTLSAVPSPEAHLTPTNFQDPAFRASIASWVPVARTLGIAGNEDEFAAWTWRAGGNIVTVRHALIAPFGPYYRLCGTKQRWTMFGGVDHTVARLQLDLRQGDTWTRLYEDGTGPRWQARVLDQERVRTVRFGFANRGNRAAWPRFVDWVAARAHEDFPDADAIRVRYQRVRLHRGGTGELRDVFWEVDRDLR